LYGYEEIGKVNLNSKYLQIGGLVFSSNFISYFYFIPFIFFNRSKCTIFELQKFVLHIFGAAVSHIPGNIIKSTWHHYKKVPGNIGAQCKSETPELIGLSCKFIKPYLITHFKKNDLI